jgi:hypothetical protein
MSLAAGIPDLDQRKGTLVAIQPVAAAGTKLCAADLRSTRNAIG